MKTSFVATVLNEEKTVGELLRALLGQSRKPDEIIIVDGGSTDSTLTRLSGLKKRLKIRNLRIVIKKGNRSAGRNFGIAYARYPVILISDAGCAPGRGWVEQISEPFRNPRVGVVAGYYAAKPKTIFEKCLIPYVFVMPDRVNPDTFLPASRSMAIRKSAWKKAGGFDERFSHNEDYAFAKKLRRMRVRMVFKGSAVVYWRPRNNLADAFNMFYRFALGDAEAGVIRPKVVFIFFRYIVFITLLVAILQSGSQLLLYALIFLSFLYVIWSMAKNYKYIQEARALYLLPLLQIASDFAVLVGTSQGLFVYNNRK